jgi:hypothetical protein
MKSRAIFLLAGASLLLAVSAPSGFVLAQEKAMTPAEVMGTKGGGNTNPSGATGELSAEGKAMLKAPAAVALPTTMHACLKMYYDATTTVMWSINAEVAVPSGKIVTAGTTVQGAICESPHWSLSGSLWPQEDIVGNRTNPTVDPACNKQITIKGSLQGFVDWEGPVPPTTFGTTSGYHFPSMPANQWFPQTTRLVALSTGPVTCTFP